MIRLGSTLTNLSLDLEKSERPQEALAMTEEAVAVLRPPV